MELAQIKEEAQEAARMDAVFPCVLRILPTAVFNKKDPIILGVDILEGIAKVNNQWRAAFGTVLQGKQPSGSTGHQAAAATALWVGLQLAYARLQMAAGMFLDHSPVVCCPWPGRAASYK